jgi:tetratricopeptide (TPR) repeat protein
VGDPLAAEAASALTMALYYERNYDEAIVQGQKAIQLDRMSAQHHLLLGRVLAAQGSYDQAIVELRNAETLSDQAPFIAAELARTYAIGGRAADALALLKRLDATGRGTPPLPAQYYAYVFGALGDRDRAFASLDKAIADHEPNLLWIRVDPRFEPLRSDPRFEAAVRRIVRNR